MMTLIRCRSGYGKEQSKISLKIVAETAFMGFEINFSAVEREPLNHFEVSGELSVALYKAVPFTSKIQGKRIRNYAHAGFQSPYIRGIIQLDF